MLYFPDYLCQKGNFTALNFPGFAFPVLEGGITDLRVTNAVIFRKFIRYKTR